MDFPSLYVLMTLSHHKGTVYLKDNDDDDEQSQESSKEEWSSSDKKKEESYCTVCTYKDPTIQQHTSRSRKRAI